MTAQNNVLSTYHFKWRLSNVSQEVISLLYSISYLTKKCIFMLNFWNHQYVYFGYKYKVFHFHNFFNCKDKLKLFSQMLLSWIHFLGCSDSPLFSTTIQSKIIDKWFTLETFDNLACHGVSLARAGQVSSSIVSNCILVKL